MLKLTFWFGNMFDNEDILKSSLRKSMQEATNRVLQISTAVGVLYSF